MTTAGRPRALDEIKKREVCALVTAGGTLRFAAKYVDCHVKTIRNEARRDPQFGERLRQAQLDAQLEPLRALRRKATTHWRAAAWLLERSQPEHFARLDQKFFKPQDVADLLENIRATLEAHLSDLYSQLVASHVINRVMSEAGLPKGRGCTFARLSDVPFGLAPNLMSPIQPRFPDKSKQTPPAEIKTSNVQPQAEAFELELMNEYEEKTGKEDVPKDKGPHLLSSLHDILAEKLQSKLQPNGKKPKDSFPKVGTPATENKTNRGTTTGGQQA